MSSITQNYYYQRSGVLFLFESVTSLIGGEKRGINSSSTVDFAEISIIYGSPQKH